LWLDEASTLTFARQSLVQIWGSLSAGTEFNPPLFYWMEHAMLTFGESEAVLRLIPAILGILTIPVFYVLGSEILDRNTGIVGAALLAFSPFQIYYSQEARAYAPMLFFFSIAFYFFLRMIRSWGRRDAILFGIFSAIAFWTHFYAFVPILALFIFALAMKAKEIAKDLRAAIPFAVSALVFAVLTLPLIYFAVQLFLARTGGAPTFGVQGIATITLTITQLSGFSDILAIVLTLLFIIGVVSLFSRDRERALLLAFVFVFPLVLSVFLSYRMPMVPRYLIYLLAAFLPAVALPLRPVCSFVRSPKLVYGVLILALVINLPVLYPYYTTQQKDDWRGASRELTGLAAPGDLVVTLPGYLRQPLNYYYNNGTAGTFEYGFSRVGDIQAAVAANPGHAAWFVVTGDILSADPQGLVLAWLNQHAQKTWTDTNKGIFILKYSG
ncbi:MAG TPA: glycosyltransferase family 39 protein, partial [Methanomicrobiales archaeon]|nr:glycosyltransferase family 39 protein [Methanomicrobiales archaeon]